MRDRHDCNIPVSDIRAILGALRMVNGRARRHTTNRATQLADVAADAEAQLSRIGALSAGAVVVHTSGEHWSCDTYRSDRILTRTTMVRSDSGWVLVRAERWYGYGALDLHLHPDLLEAARSAGDYGCRPLPDELVPLVTRFIPPDNLPSLLQRESVGVRLAVIAALA